VRKTSKAVETQELVEPGYGSRRQHAYEDSDILKSFEKNIYHYEITGKLPSFLQIQRTDTSALCQWWQPVLEGDPEGDTRSTL